jgi:hypothetical protein
VPDVEADLRQAPLREGIPGLPTFHGAARRYDIASTLSASSRRWDRRWDVKV